jgi:hypothetical protein
VKERRGRRRRKLLDDLKETRRYWKLKGDALDCTMRRNRFGRDVRPALKMRDFMYEGAELFSPLIRCRYTGILSFVF